MSIIVPLEGFGGGNNPLNFKVVGNPQPESPKENTIWVNTDTEITGWQFASDDPNLLDFNNWANGIGVLNGTKTVSGNAITLTSNASGDCYTDFDSRSLAVIPCIPGKTYVLNGSILAVLAMYICSPTHLLKNWFVWKQVLAKSSIQLPKA